MRRWNVEEKRKRKSKEEDKPLIGGLKKGTVDPVGNPAALDPVTVDRLHAPQSFRRFEL